MMVCKYRNVSERDMDHLFMEAFATDPNFTKIFLDETEQRGKEFSVVQVERSKIDSGLGETDITVICEIDRQRYALLIEDKIDAIAMAEQHERYLKRGRKGIDDFTFLFFAPRNTAVPMQKPKNMSIL